jgi:tetratricopeptide (TPR) repeat protein/transcriptional regulator with XRE-family HTH domain
MGAHPGQARPGEWLRQQRVAAGLTQEDLAERSRVSVRAIADLERGRTRRPYPSSVRALVRALGLPEADGDRLVAVYRAGGAPGQASTGQGEADEQGDSGDPADKAGADKDVTVPRQLPTRVPHFAGRARQLAELDAVLDEAASDQATGATGVVISAIGGTAGVGKTALALHWAHRVAHRFPDGQLYANLRGFDAGAGTPADPADVLRGFLDALGVHPERRPADVEGLAGLFRSVVAGRRMLVLLDNAADVAQVRPLLPASPECLVIVTSRRELAALAAREGARLLRLDVLSEQEANELLMARLGVERAAEEPWAVTQLATLCARLPLALSVVVARAAAAPKMPLSSLAAELTELGGRLDALDVGDPAANVRTVLSLSYRHLPDTAARMFRLITLDAVASGVIPETFSGKASALAWLEAESQVLLKVSGAAARLGYDAHAWRLPVVLWTFHNVCGHWHDGTRLHQLALEAARRNGDISGEAHVLRGLGSFAMSVGAFDEAHGYLAGAQSLFKALEDDLGLARTDVIFSQALEFQGRFAEALTIVSDALRLSESAPGNRYMMLVRASALNGSAWNSVQLGDLSQARAFCQQAIELCQKLGYSPGEAGTWDTLGVVLQRLSLHGDAVTCFRRAISLDREMGNRYDLAMVLAHLGETYVAVGDLAGAREAWDESLRILRALHHPLAPTVREQLAALSSGRLPAGPADVSAADADADAGAA